MTDSLLAAAERLDSRTFKFRIYPNRVQVSALEVHLAEACRLYNAAVQERRDAWRVRRQSISFYSQDKQLKEIRASGDIGIVGFSIARDVLRRVDFAFTSFFRRVKAKRTPGFPRFKSVRRYDSLSCPVGDGAKILKGKVRLYGIGDIKVKLHRPLVGEAKQVTVRRSAGRWYVHIATTGAPASHPQPYASEVGIDVGLSSFAVLSDASVVENPRLGRLGESVVRVAQRRVARRRRGSAGRLKAIRLLQRALERVRNQRGDFHHKTSRSIVDTYGRIAVENLNIPYMARTRLAKSVHDAGWRSFLNKLRYKAESAGRQYVEVNTRGTSQTCLCGARVEKTLAVRRHDCPECGLSAPRDFVSAQLILGLGRSLWAPSCSTESGLPTKPQECGVVTERLERMSSPSSARSQE